MLITSLRLPATDSGKKEYSKHRIILVITLEISSPSSSSLSDGILVLKSPMEIQFERGHKIGAPYNTEKRIIVGIMWWVNKDRLPSAYRSEDELNAACLRGLVDGADVTWVPWRQFTTKWKSGLFYAEHVYVHLLFYFFLKNIYLWILILTKSVNWHITVPNLRITGWRSLSLIFNMHVQSVDKSIHTPLNLCFSVVK